MIADVASVSGYISEEEKDEMMTYIMSVMASGLYQGSFLKGVDDFTTMLSTTTRKVKPRRVLCRTTSLRRHRSAAC